MILQGNSINAYHKHLEQSTITISQLIIQNTSKKIRLEARTTATHSSKSRETPLGIYLGMMLHVRIRKKGLIENLHHLGISVSYGRVMELNATVGNAVLSKYAVEGIVCPPSLKPNVFTTAAIDNIDHNPSSTTANGSFHGTGISLFQRQNSEKTDIQRNSRESDVDSKRLLNLLSAYIDVPPVLY